MFAIHDLVAIGYFACLHLVLWASAPSAARDGCLLRVDLWLAALTASGLLARGAHRAHRLWAVLYRACLVGAVLDSYLMLRQLLPAVRSDVVDDSLLRLDLRLFGFEPALWLQRFNVAAVVEYFSFYYLSYFFIIAAFMVAMLWLRRPDRVTSEYAIGTMLVLMLGQLGYLLVPATGPIHHFADLFDGPVRGGVLWASIGQTVNSSGALKDVFPSLHTAIPCYYALFAWRQARQNRRWRPAAWLVSWFAAHIVISTMLLRWHYLIDVLAGLLLALLSWWLAARLAELDTARRQQHGLPAAWP